VFPYSDIGRVRGLAQASFSIRARFSQISAAIGDKENEPSRGAEVQVALILPRHRLGTWHARLAASLSGTHDVKVFMDDGAPPYPLRIRAWLAVERRLYRTQRGPLADLANRAPAHIIDRRVFDAVVDLSERPQPQLDAISVRYDGSTDSQALLERLLAHQTPHLTMARQGAPGILAESFPAIDDKFRLSRGLQIAFARCISLIERSLQSRRERPAGGPRAALPTADGLPNFIGRFVTHKAANLLGRLATAPQWSVALRRVPGSFVPVANVRRHIYADPFLYAWCGRTFLFVEDYSDATQKAVISAAEIVDGHLAKAPVPILDRPYHLSYPLVFAEAGETFMLPETAGNNALELYRAVVFPWEWRLETVLMEGLALADATPVFHQNRWWLFAGMAQHGTTDRDELFVFYSDKLTGPWQPHPENPVKSDCRSARPAGRVVRHGGRLLRPAQDCEQAYGSAVVWHEITELSRSHFAETEIARVGAPLDLGLDGLHHFDEAGELQAIDFRTTRSLGVRHRHQRLAMSSIGSGLDRVFQSAISFSPR
jgi:hypothetical protein